MPDITFLAVKTLDQVGAQLVNSIGNTAMDGATADGYRQNSRATVTMSDSTAYGLGRLGEAQKQFDGAAQTYADKLVEAKATKSEMDELKEYVREFQEAVDSGIYGRATGVQTRKLEEYKEDLAQRISAYTNITFEYSAAMDEITETIEGVHTEEDYAGGADRPALRASAFTSAHLADGLTLNRADMNPIEGEPALPGIAVLDSHGNPTDETKSMFEAISVDEDGVSFVKPEEKKEEVQGPPDEDATDQESEGAGGGSTGGGAGGGSTGGGAGGGSTGGGAGGGSTGGGAGGSLGGGSGSRGSGYEALSSDEVYEMLQQAGGDPATQLSGGTADALGSTFGGANPMFNTTAGTPGSAGTGVGAGGMMGAMPGSATAGTAGIPGTGAGASTPVTGSTAGTGSGIGGTGGTKMSNGDFNKLMDGLRNSGASATTSPGTGSSSGTSSGSSSPGRESNIRSSAPATAPTSNTDAGSSGGSTVKNASSAGMGESAGNVRTQNGSFGGGNQQAGSSGGGRQNGMMPMMPMGGMGGGPGGGSGGPGGGRDKVTRTKDDEIYGNDIKHTDPIINARKRRDDTAPRFD